MASKLVDGDDGLPAQEVGRWIADKHRLLCEYLRLQAGPRGQFVSGVGATYIELFCGPGRAKLKDSGQFVDGSAVAAWRASVEQGAPFTNIYIADLDPQRRTACAERLRRLGAPVVELQGSALDASAEAARLLDPYALHFTFLDPYSLGALDLGILRNLAQLKRMDIMAHVSAMDLYRNLDREVQGDNRTNFESFAPGLLQKITQAMRRDERRRVAMDYWRGLVEGLGLQATPDVEQVHNSVNRTLYWLMLICRHDLAKRFWTIALKSNKQPDLFG